MFRTIKLLFTIVFASLTLANAANRPSPVFYNVKDYGAIGNGTNLDSKAINAAIDAAATAGGGTVYLPAGNYLSGSIHLKSNISLFIDQGATLMAAPVSAENGYDEEEPGPGNAYQDSGHSHWHNSLIWGETFRKLNTTAYATSTDSLFRSKKNG